MRKIEVHVTLNIEEDAGITLEEMESLVEDAFGYSAGVEVASVEAYED